ncbi:hypothetical protein Tco_1469886, partial [Tanacetum coccineum]
VEVSTTNEEGYLDPKGDILFFENLLCDNSSPQPPENSHAVADTIVESLSPPPIPVMDSDSHMEEIDLFLATDDSWSQSILIENYDSERDIHSLEDLLNDNSPFPEKESSNFDLHDNPSVPRPPPEPPDFCFEPITAMMKDFEDCNQGERILFLNVEDVNSFTFDF